MRATLRLRQSRAMLSAESDNAVTRWFAAAFDRLHPLLQDLHRRATNSMPGSRCRCSAQC